MTRRFGCKIRIVSIYTIRKIKRLSSWASGKPGSWVLSVEHEASVSGIGQEAWVSGIRHHVSQRLSSIFGSDEINDATLLPPMPAETDTLFPGAISSQLSYFWVDVCSPVRSALGWWTLLQNLRLYVFLSSKLLVD